MRPLVLLALLALGCARAPLEKPLLVVGPRPFQDAVKALVQASGSPVVDGQGASTANILAARRGAVDLAFTSRDLLPDEDTHSVRAFLVAREGVAFAVHPSNPAQAVPLDRLEEAVSGQVADWSELGGRTGPIKVLLAGPRVRDLVPPTRARSVSVEEGAADPGALVLFPSGSVPAGARLLQPDGVALEERTLLSGRYPASRSYFAVIRADASPEAQAFLAFCLGPQGQAVLAKQGLARVD